MLFIFALVIIEIVLFFQNYTPDTFLIGWDNVMPEFNLWLNFKRAFFSLWQDYRGLGLVDGLSHTANLFHTIYITILSLLLPESLVRYVFITLTHLVGGIGFYFLMKKLCRNNIASFIGALFYMFNLGIVQMYFAPLEVFAIHFAALPLLSLTILNALEKPSKKNLIIFAGTSLALTPQSFVPTIFIAYSILFGFLMVFDLIFQKNIKKIILISVIYIATNAFWLFPYVYSVKQTGNIIPETRINQYSSEEIFYRNKDFGDLFNVFTFKGFMLSTPEINMSTNKTVMLMETWNKHANTNQYKVISFTIFILFLVGIWKMFREKQKQLIPFAASMGVAFFFLANNTFILESLNNIVRSTFPIIGEAFRIPFTKFITLFTFCFSLFFAFGISYIQKTSKYMQSLICIIGIILIGYTVLPAFTGNFYSSLLRGTLPNEYKQVIQYFQTIDDTKRIAMLPMETFWNWEYRSWGHRGSGFLWYGIPQPILMRPFDPWSLENEQVYNEMHYALERNNLALFENVLDKYNIDYLLIDTNVRYPSLPKLYDYDKLENFLSTSEYIQKDNTFNSLLIYKTINNDSKKDIQILNNPSKVLTNAQFYYEDIAFVENRDYVIDNQNPEIIYPFSSLFSEKTQQNLSIEATVDNNMIKIKPKSDLFSEIESGIYNLELNNFNKETMVPVKVTFTDTSVMFTSLYPDITIGNITYKIKPVLVEIPANNPTRISMTEVNQSATNGDNIYLFKGYPNTVTILGGNGSTITQVITDPFFETNVNVEVNLQSDDEITLQIPKISSISSIENAVENNLFTIGDNNPPPDSKILQLIANENNSEVVLWTDELFHSTGYIMFVEAEWKKGLPISLYVDNTFDKRPAMESILNKSSGNNILILPPVDNIHRGYGIHIIAKTIGEEKTEAIIRDFDMYPIPFHIISNIKLIKNTQMVTNNDTEIQINKLTPYKYEISNKKLLEKDVIYFDQSYHSGWKAFIINNNSYSKVLPYFFGTELKNHIKINNWANGWQLSEEIPSYKSIMIIFWPSLLMYCGYGFLFLSLIGILLFKKINSEN